MLLGETAAWFASWSWTLLVYVPTTFLLLLFPDGRLPSPRWRPVAWCAVLGLIGFLAGYVLTPGPLEDFPQITNPYGVDSPILEAVAVAGAILAAASMVASAVSLIVRMRRAGRVERQQIKWLAYGGALAVGAVFVGGVISVWIGEVGYALTSIGLLGMPIFTGVAIARYRLYEIDIVINRTLVYGLLTAILAGVYFGGVTATQALLGALTGQEQLPQLVVVASTLVIAALFTPLRRASSPSSTAASTGASTMPERPWKPSQPSSRRDGSERTERRSGRGGEGDYAAGARLTVVATKPPAKESETQRVGNSSPTRGDRHGVVAKDRR